jgi:hypothetical protein
MTRRTFIGTLAGGHVAAPFAGDAQPETTTLVPQQGQVDTLSDGVRGV